MFQASLIFWYCVMFIFEHSKQCIRTVLRAVCSSSSSSRRAAGSNLKLWPHAGFWGSDVHRQRSQLPLCLPQRLPSSSTFHHPFSLALFTSRSSRVCNPPCPYVSMLTSLVCLTFPPCLCSDKDIRSRRITRQCLNLM